jgi:hypothetical protein
MKIMGNLDEFEDYVLWRIKMNCLREPGGNREAEKLNKS